VLCSIGENSGSLTSISSQLKKNKILTCQSVNEIISETNTKIDYFTFFLSKMKFPVHVVSFLKFGA